MTKAIRVHNTGGPEVMTLEDVEVGQPGAGEVRVRHTAIGLNFIDVYFRTGAYPVQTPFTPGFEAAGVVEAVGEGVNNLSVGDRIAYAAQPIGAYAEERLIAADRLVKLPDEIADRVGAAIMLKGMTTEYLLRRTYAISAGDTVLFHAAAGGVGLIACQWASHLGATVIGTVGSEEKAEIESGTCCKFSERYLAVTVISSIVIAAVKASILNTPTIIRMLRIIFLFIFELPLLLLFVILQ